MKFFFKLILKVSAFYLEKQKSFIPKKKILSRCQYQNKTALFTDPIFSEGFGPNVTIYRILKILASLNLINAQTKIRYTKKIYKSFALSQA
jgi:hypothetical protein